VHAGSAPWQRYPYHRPTSALRYPEDEGWHEALPVRAGARHLTSPSLGEMEWVYLNSHLTETGGARRRFVVFAAYFTQQLRFLVVRAWDDQDRYLGSWTGSAVGLLTAAGGRRGLVAHRLAKRRLRGPFPHLPRRSR
jgi:hypothetical protein